MAKDCKVEVVPIEAEELVLSAECLVPGAKNNHQAGSTKHKAPSTKHQALSTIDGILVPGGFGSRGVEGKIAAIRYAREKKIPFLGICLGMQCTVIEYARDVLGWTDANSTEFDERTAHPVIDLMEEQRGVTQKGGTMRLGAYPCVLKKGTLAARLYAGGSRSSATGTSCSLTISERHRHRYEFANGSEEQKAIEAAGLKVCGTSPDGKLVEIVELPKHPYFIACQFHPEFKSRPTAPHPLFVGLVSAALHRSH
jgi:CTP synthase